MADAYSASDDKAGLFRKLRKLFRLDEQFSAKWRDGAKEDFDFVAGEQWSQDDKDHLKSLMRPVITMNRTHTIINAVSGQEMSNRQEVRYIPRELGAAKPNELLTQAAHWFLDAADGPDEDSEAFLHTCICGMGWTDTTLEFETDEAGAPDMAAVSPIEMYWDRNARKNDLTDSERVWRVRKMPLVKARELFPDADDGDLDAGWATPDGDEGDPTDQDRDRLYRGDDNDNDDADDDDQVTIVHCQYIVKAPAWDVISPLTGQTQEMSDGDYKTYSKRAKELGLAVKAARKFKRVVKDCWLGGVVLQTNDALCQDKFRYQCITGYRDENKGTFYGLVRGMKDPQRWANKWLSQTLDILNSQAKGGIIAERGVTDNVRDFEKNWARADKIGWVDDGSLSGPSGPRIQPKPVGQFPAGFFQLMQFSFEMIQQVPGVSPELLGQADRDQPASLEYQRRQAGMTILQPLFKNLKLYRKHQGHVILYILQNHMSDGRLVRIVGEDEAQYVPLMKQADVKYDIIVDDSPTSPNQKEMIWSMIADKFWDMPTETQLAFLKYSPFPTSVQQALEKAAESHSQSPGAQLQQAGAQATVQLETAKIGLTQAQTAQAQSMAQKTASEIGMGTAGPTPAEHAARIMEIQQEGQIKAAQMQGQQQLAAQKAAADVTISQQKMQSDAAIKHQGMVQEAQIKQGRALADVQIQAFKAREAAKIAASKPAPGAAS